MLSSKILTDGQPCSRLQLNDTKIKSSSFSSQTVKPNLDKHQIRLGLQNYPCRCRLHSVHAPIPPEHVASRWFRSKNIRYVKHCEDQLNCDTRQHFDDMTDRSILDIPATSLFSLGYEYYGVVFLSCKMKRETSHTFSTSRQ